MRGPGRCHAEAAVTHHHRGHAVPRRDGQHAVPHHLRIVMRVDVDEARGDDAAAGIERLGSSPGDLAEGSDLAGADADIARLAGCSGAIDYGAADDLEIVLHGFLLTTSPRPSPW